MKKKWIHDALFFCIKTKTWKIMRLSVLFLFLCFSSTWAMSGYSQATKLTLKMNGSKVIDVLNEIEKRSEFYFLFNQKLLNAEREVNIDVREKTIDAILEKLFSGTDVNYHIYDRQIVLTTFNKELMPEQARVVSGKVTDTNGQPLPGVTVIVKGTPQGTVTNPDGEYTLTNIPEEATLLFSFVGMNSQEIQVSEQKIINVMLTEATIGLDDVVVTALGFTREKKSLGYSVGEVKGEQLNETPQNSVLSALQGKVSGVKINQTYGLAGSSVQMTIRGAMSLGDNDPLYIIDGVPITNSSNGVFEGAVDLGNAISDLNPDDIESMSVLKGPSAAALYGTRAGNGVVLITTKSGKGAKKGIGVSYNTSIVFDTPYKFFPLQYEFASSKTGAHSYDELAFETWGPKLNNGFMAEMWNSNGEKVELVSYPNRVEEFYQVGHTTSNSLGFTSRGENAEIRISASKAKNEGITPNTGFDKNNISMNGTAKLTKKLNVSGVFNINDASSDNRPSFGGGYNDPVRMLFAMGPQQNINNFKDYWVPGMENVQQLTYYPTDGNRWNNPYFIANEYLTGYRRTQSAYKLQADWEFYKDFTVMIRYSRNDFNQRIVQRAAFSEKDNPNGLYMLKYDHNREDNWEGMFGYTNINIIDKLSMTANLGGAIRYNYYDYISNETGKLIEPNLYNISNAAPGTLIYSAGWGEKQVNSLYGIISLGYANAVYLDITARNDWSSTLPPNNWSYFYPSASLSMLLNQMTSLPAWISLAKLRAGYAQVGKDTDPYSLSKSISTQQDWGSAPRKYINGSFPNADLKPEIATSIEFGTDLSFIDNKIRFDITYYQMENRNQIFGLAQPVVSGATSRTVNAGLIKSRGWDASLNVNVLRKGDWTIDLGSTFTRNRTSIEELAEGVLYIQNDTKAGESILRTYIGDDVGSIYQYPFKRVEDINSPYYGFPILSASGITEVNKSSDDVIELIGNYNPDFNLGFQLNAKYKRFTLFANIDWRSGGEFYSRTMEFMKNNGMLEGYYGGESYDPDISLRDQILANPDKYINSWIGGRYPEYGGLPWPAGKGAGRVDDASFIPGVREDGNGGYIENFGDPETTVFLSPYDASKYAERYLAEQNLYSSTYVKLRELSIKYDFDRELANKLKLTKLSLSLVGQNLFQWHKSGIFVDPENAYFKGSEGTEYYSVVPRTRSIGFKLNVEL